ncbi:MAG: SipW-dependent-type signal peptide-containing protein, partial [Methanocellales archaeon]|nr:SipW-dependent-type signal peptide-containing protein [Methanocellales archaeon]
MIKNSMIMFMMIFVASFLLGSMIFGGTHAYLSDTETSTGNTFIAAWYRSGEIVGFNVPAEVISGNVV